MGTSREQDQPDGSEQHSHINANQKRQNSYRGLKGKSCIRVKSMDAVKEKTGETDCSSQHKLLVC